MEFSNWIGDFNLYRKNEAESELQKEYKCQLRIGAEDFKVRRMKKELYIIRQV